MRKIVSFGSEHSSSTER